MAREPTAWDVAPLKRGLTAQGVTRGVAGWGGYVDPDEDPVVTAAREVEEETGWRPRDVLPLVSLQPIVGSADAENLLFVAMGAEHVGDPPDINEAERIAWIPLASVRERIDRGEIVGAASQVGLLHMLACAPAIEL